MRSEQSLSWNDEAADRLPSTVLHSSGGPEKNKNEIKSVYGKVVHVALKNKLFLRFVTLRPWILSSFTGILGDGPTQGSS